MLHLDIPRRTHEAFLHALTRSHLMRLHVRILDNEEQVVGHFQTRYGSSHVLGGSVAVDTGQDVSRSLSLEFFDPRKRLKFTPETASEAGIFTGYFVKVSRAILVPHHNLHPRQDVYPSPNLFPGEASSRIEESGTWVRSPVFAGPLTHFSNQGGHTTIEAQGKQTLLLAPHYAAQGYRLSKGMKIDDAIKHVLARVGETKFKIPQLPYKLKNHRAVNPQDEPWRVVAGGSDDTDQGGFKGALIHHAGKHPHHIFIDGDGDVRVERLNKNRSVHTFDEDWLLEEPQIEYEGLEFVNRVVVRGVRPKGKGKHRVHAAVQLPKENPLSPENLERANQRPSYRTVFVSTDLKTEHECRQRAWHILAHKSTIPLEASFSTLPMPLVEELDVVRVKTPTMLHEFPLKQFEIPLVAGDAMSVGRNKNLHSRPRRTRRHPHAGPARGGRGGRGLGRGHDGKGGGSK